MSSRAVHALSYNYAYGMGFASWLGADELSREGSTGIMGCHSSEEPFVNACINISTCVPPFLFRSVFQSGCFFVTQLRIWNGFYKPYKTSESSREGALGSLCNDSAHKILLRRVDPSRKNASLRRQACASISREHVLIKVKSLWMTD
jgi:hypothetical protein